LLFGVLLILAGFVAYWAQSAASGGVRVTTAPSDTPKF